MTRNRPTTVTLLKTETARRSVYRVEVECPRTFGSKRTQVRVFTVTVTAKRTTGYSTETVTHCKPGTAKDHGRIVARRAAIKAHAAR